MAEQKFFFILLLSGLCCLAIAPLFLFQNSERNSVSFTAPGLMLIGIAFVPLLAAAVLWDWTVTGLI